MIFTTIAKARKETGLSYLGTKNISAKLIKNQKVSNVVTYCMYLAPAETSGFNVCNGATKECKLGCLASSGHRAIEIASGKSKILDSRIKKTKLFFEHNEFFMAWLVAEMRVCKKYAEKNSMPFSFRLNGTSDIDWRLQLHEGKNVFQIFSDYQGYDYTKIATRYFAKHDNYHLTFSYTGRNVEQCLYLLGKGENVAVVFNTKKNKPLPETFLGYPVIDGDLTDARQFDPKGVVVGLRFKMIGDKAIQKQVLESCFVVKEDLIEQEIA